MFCIESNGPPLTLCLQRAGVAFKVDNRLSNLVNLNEDPQLSEMLLYIIKEGTTVIGQKSPGSEHEIQLTGALVAMNHWWVLGHVLCSTQCSVCTVYTYYV